MRFLKWLWGLIYNAFLSFVKEAVNQITQKFVIEMKDFALQIVIELSQTDLSDEEKRAEAFEQIKTEAIERGLEFRDSAINLLIELCVAKLKNMEV